MVKEKKTRIPFAMFFSILALAGPTMLEQLMQTAVQYVDTAMVGSLGTAATAAVGATTTVNWLINSTISALGVGFLAYIAQSVGRGETNRVNDASNQAVLLSLILGVALTVITLSFSGVIPKWMQVEAGIRDLAARYFFILYAPMLARTLTIIFGTLLRAVGDTKTPMKIGIGVNIINVLLNFLLIYPTRNVLVFGKNIKIIGAGYGVEGAAAASAVAFLAGGIMITIALFKKPMLRPTFKKLRFDMSVLAPCLRVAFPNALQRFGTSFGYVAFAAMVNSLGEVSTAAHTIANTVESAFYIPGYGMQTAAATLAGNAFGARDTQKIKQLSKSIILIEVVLMIISGGLLFVFAPDMMRIFSHDKTVITLGATVLRLVALSEPFYGVSIIIEGMLQGMGKTFMPFVCNIIGMWGIRIVGTFICTQIFSLSLVSAWGCMILHNMLLFIMFLSYYKKGERKDFS